MAAGVPKRLRASIAIDNAAVVKHDDLQPVVGGILALILNEATVVYRSGPMTGAIRRVAGAVSATALSQVFGLVANDEHKRL